MPFLDDVRQRLGVAADADEQTVLGALDEALEERADDEHDETEEETTAVQLPDGVVAVDAQQLADLQARAARGDQARAQQEREHRQGLVDAAVRDGRIPAARHAAWLKQLEADPGAEATLASLAKGLVPVDEIGRSGSVEELDGDALYASIFGAEG